MRLRALLQELGGKGSTADAIYRVLRHGIVHGDLAPGERLGSDALATELRVSRTPVREAVRSSKPKASPLMPVPVWSSAPSAKGLTELFYVREALDGERRSGMRGGQ
jgi:hypothetical protein